MKKYHKFNINNIFINIFINKCEPFFCIKCNACYDACCAPSSFKEIYAKSKNEIVEYLNESNIEGCVFNEEEWIIKQIIE